MYEYFAIYLWQPNLLRKHFIYFPLLWYLEVKLPKISFIVISKQHMNEYFVQSYMES